jgi:predicted O-linked N-acetylglucosamine transferase (SPINDLY family)
MRENAVMQLSSVANNGSHAQRIRAQVESVLAEYQQPAVSSPRFLPHSRPNRTLRIGWITGDVAYHPVARFVYGLFASAPNRSHQHLLIDINDHQKESSRGLFDGLPGLQVKVIHQQDHAAAVDAIRAMELDLAIDLSGWTGGHFMRGFHQRLAPTQVNYLGYFATAGIPAMDVWLGDHALFPEVVPEWHTEALYRLNRCFIAWQPQSPLPEADVEVVDAASMAGGLRFGSFNHNRKLSDRTLALWGELLRSVPGSSLVLKASNRDDSSTQELLSRRMRRCGLDPERVIWLPRAAGPVEHLRQYGLVDVALDCFPNGGCTTTCESLWMGTPVITLSGDAYVSRMSTAVLHGANLPQWCASSELAYLELARAQADRLSWLRQNRSHWRSQLQSSPLGDAADLMRHLEAAFSDLAAASR